MADDPEPAPGRREQLLDAAALCFARGGFHATTVAEISLQAQCSPGLLYRYFAGKEALVSALVDREAGRTVAALSAVRGSADLVRDLDRAAATSATGWEDPRLAALHIQIVAEAARGSAVSEPVRRHFQDVIEALAGTLKIGQESGVVDHQLDPAATARALVALASGLTLLRAVDSGPTAPAPSPTSYVCPMHPEVTASEPAKCPQCGMKLVPSEAAPVAQSAEGAAHGGHEHGGHELGGHEHGDGLEWEDLMPEINRASDPSNMVWQLIDRETGAENGAISWAFTVGDRVKIRLVNEMDSDHPMHHPFHIHGAGRFLILARDEQPEQNLVWKDTVLLRAGETVDILLDVSNPGLWMAHCHIAEHTESGMMFSFNVARRSEAT
jgi:AcrR family transcriptional regulator